MWPLGLWKPFISYWTMGVGVSHFFKICKMRLFVCVCRGWGEIRVVARMINPFQEDEKKGVFFKNIVLILIDRLTDSKILSNQTQADMCVHAHTRIRILLPFWTSFNHSLFWVCKLFPVFATINNITMTFSWYTNPPKSVIISLEKIPGSKITGSKCMYLNVLCTCFKVAFLKDN